MTTPDRNPVTGYFISNVKMRRSKFHFDEETSIRLWDASVRAIADADAKSVEQSVSTSSESTRDARRS